MAVIPQAVNKWFQDNLGRSMGRKFPLNLADQQLIPESLQQEIFRFMQDNYIWPQIQERSAFEPLWDKLQKLARINLDAIDLNFAMETPAGREQAESGRRVPKVSDSVIYDAIDRLSNINHFISFKDGLPAQFVRPDYIEQPFETDLYNPLDRKIKAANALLRWNASNVQFYRKHLILCRHHYTYGISFARSEFQFKAQNVMRQDNLGNIIPKVEITEIGATFDPISVRRLWLNYRIPAWNMDAQPCPFYFEETPYFAMLQNQYNPDTNPFGLSNLDKLDAYGIGKGTQYMWGAQEMDSLRKAMEDRLSLTRKAMGDTAAAGSLPQLLNTEYSVEAMWTFYPMLPLDPETLEWKTRADGTAVPFQRYIVQTYGSNLVNKQCLLRLQLSFYPNGQLPIFGSAHMPDLDSGAYCPALGEVLFNHYKEIVTCTNQYIENKEHINNPSTMVMQGSPCMDDDLTRPGGKHIVNGPNDVQYREVVDATSSTVNMRQMLREEAKASSKIVDAILGQAMGGRTSATEAGNAYQASMSGITTDINMFNFDMSGEGFARRVWRYFGLWVDPDLLRRITGSFGFNMSPEDLWIELDIQTNVGSTYIDSIVRQQNLRYVAESTRGEPSINRGEVFKDLFEEMKFGNPRKYIIDFGMSKEIARATDQAERTLLGEPVMISPAQNHQIAMEVKSTFIEDESDESLAKLHPENIPMLINQIMQHQQLFLIQLQQQQQIAMLQSQEQMALEAPQKSGGNESQSPVPVGAGGVAQQGGGYA